MAHDASKVLMGSVGSSDSAVTCEVGDPASFPAGVAVCRTSTGALVLDTAGTGEPIGISLGKSVKDITKTDVCRSGSRVPVQLQVSFIDPTWTWVVPGAPVYFDSFGTGQAIDFVNVGTGFASGAIYVSGPMKGILEDGTEIDVAIIDFPGGL